MTLPVTIPNTFATATASIPLSQLDTNFSTLANAVNGISDGSETLANAKITTANVTTLIVTGNATIGDASADTVTLNSTMTANTAVIFSAGTSAAPSITTSGDLNTGIYFPAADTIGFVEGGAEAMRIDSSGNVGIGTTSPASRLQIATDNANEIVIKTLRQRVPGSGVRIGRLAAGAYSTGTTEVDGGFINFDTDGSWSSTSAPTVMSFATTASGSTSPAERMRIDSSGNLLVGTTTYGGGANVAGAGLNPVGQIAVERDGGIAGVFNRFSSDGQLVLFRRQGSSVGDISVTTLLTTYNTTSDYRLKNNQAPLTGSGAFIDALQPKTWNWAQDGSKGAGFIAHEFAEVSPSSVSGIKDAVDAEGKPVYQAMQASSAEVIANLVAEIQSLRQRLAAANL
jgi:hypothetical protein